jgi:hypothetical protein
MRHAFASIREKGKMMNNVREANRLIVEELPELETEVAIAGTAKQQEVGGGFCLGVAAGIAIYYSV